MRVSSITKNAGKACNNRLYRHIRTFEKIIKNYFVIYSYLNDKSDEFLEAHNYGRDEIKAGLKDITVRYGVDGFAEMFLQ